MELRHPTTISVRDAAGERAGNLLELARTLAEIDVRPFHVLSLALDVRWRDEQQRQRVRLFVRDEVRKARARLGDSPEDRALAADLDRVEERVEERIRRAIPLGGLMIYLSGPAALELEIGAQWPLDPALIVDHAPAVRPLVSGLRDPGRALIAVVDAQNTRVYQLDGTGPDLLADLTGEVPSRHKRGGWSQLALQHHRAEHLDQLHREAAAEIVRAFDAPLGDSFAGRLHVLLGGRHEAVANLKAHLPPRVLEHAVEIDGLAPSLSEDRIAQVVDEALTRILHEEATAEVRHLAELAGRGLCAFGAPAVLEVLSERRVSRLLLSPQLHGDGWQCVSCGQVGALLADAVTNGCPSCGATGSLERIELGELIVRHALRQHAAVETLDPGSGLERHGGVATELRYPAPM